MYPDNESIAVISHTFACITVIQTGASKMDRKKELKREFKETGTTAGVVSLRCKANGRVLLMTRQDLNGCFVRTRMSLESGRHHISALQKDWNEFGADNFEFEILDTLNKADLVDRDAVAELEALKELWREKLAAPPANATFYD